MPVPIDGTLGRAIIAPMKDLNQQIRERIEALVNELQVLVRQHAVAAVTDSLGGTTPMASRAKPAAPKSPRQSKKKASSRRGRPAEDLSELTGPIVTMLRATPGQRAEDLGRGLGTTAKALKRPIDRLLADGAIRKEGQARATRYYVS